MNPSTHLMAFEKAALDITLPGDQIGAFNFRNQLCGVAKVKSTKNNLSITLFGDDPSTHASDGFIEDELINFKLFRPSTTETFNLDVGYNTKYDHEGTFKLNGISVISNVKLAPVSVNESIGSNIRIFPNPTEGKVEIIIDGLHEKVSGKIFDLRNNEFMQFELDGTKQEQQKQLDLSTLPAGIYLISITGESFSFVEKVVVM